LPTLDRSTPPVDGGTKHSAGRCPPYSGGLGPDAILKAERVDGVMQATFA